MDAQLSITVHLSCHNELSNFLDECIKTALYKENGKAAVSKKVIF